MPRIGSAHGVLAVTATLVLGLALGACGSTTPVGASPTPSAPPTTSPAASPSATPAGDDRMWAFFSRDQLPPIGAFVRGKLDDASAEKRVESRIRALHGAASGGVPAGAVNTVARLGKSGQLDMTARVQGDVATLEFGPGQFDEIHGSAMIGSVIEQLVYTASEEAGIRRVLLAERGKGALEIDNMASIKDPSTREQAFVYASFGLKSEQRVALEDDPRPASLTTKLSNELAPGLTRFEVVLTAAAAVPEGFWSPRMSAELIANTDERALPGKWVLKVTLPGGTDPRGAQPAVQTVESSPVRAIRTATNASGTTYELGLDDARPWRVSLEPVHGAPAPPTPSMRLIVDLGGHPQSISESVAVYEPKREDAVQGQVVITGAARAFEAHVAYRLKDHTGKEVANGFVTASLGTSPVWGTFQTKLILPAGASGALTLEVFWPSPRDGADVGLVAIPLRVR